MYTREMRDLEVSEREVQTGYDDFTTTSQGSDLRHRDDCNECASVYTQSGAIPSLGVRSITYSSIE